MLLQQKLRQGGQETTKPPACSETSWCVGHATRPACQESQAVLCSITKHGLTARQRLLGAVVAASACSGLDSHITDSVPTAAMQLRLTALTYSAICCEV